MRPHLPPDARLSTVLAPPNRPLPLWLLYPLFFVAVYLSHLTLLRLPYFWDEAGYYIPAAWDCFRTGTLIPQTTLTNAHPPLPSLLLAGWWHLAGFAVYNTRVLICMVSSAALLAVFRIARGLASPAAAVVVTLLTAIYPVWFAQSTLAHADIFAAAFTLWALSVYLAPFFDPALRPRYILASALFSLSVLSKETAIVTPAALALWQAVLLVTDRKPSETRSRIAWIVTLLVPVLPLAAWYAYHHHMTGYTFGNPQYLRYNALANLGLSRVLIGLWHRITHLTLHMNLFVATGCTIAVLLMPSRRGTGPPATSRQVLSTLAVILMGNAVAFSVLGGALLTRYLLPMYPLVLLICVTQWQLRHVLWPGLAALTAAGFLSALWINPPYRFAPEDNLAYRDMIVLHEQAISILVHRFPDATVLTAWPATQELARPELGYIQHPMKNVAIDDFSAAQLTKAEQDPGAYDTMFIFSTKWSPPEGQLNLSLRNEATDTRFFDFHRDLRPREAAAMLHGEVVWQAERKGEWSAILRFPRSSEALLAPPPSAATSIIGR